MDGETPSKRDIKTHVLFEIATEVANRGKPRSRQSPEPLLMLWCSGGDLLCPQV
jgi:hypothetical protein